MAICGWNSLILLQKFTFFFREKSLKFRVSPVRCFEEQKSNKNSNEERSNNFIQCNTTLQILQYSLIEINENLKKKRISWSGLIFILDLPTTHNTELYNTNIWTKCFDSLYVMKPFDFSQIIYFIYQSSFVILNTFNRCELSKK